VLLLLLIWLEYLQQGEVLSITRFPVKMLPPLHNFKPKAFLSSLKRLFYRKGRAGYSLSLEERGLG